MLWWLLALTIILQRDASLPSQYLLGPFSNGPYECRRPGMFTNSSYRTVPRYAFGEGAVAGFVLLLG